MTHAGVPTVVAGDLTPHRFDRHRRRSAVAALEQRVQVDERRHQQNRAGHQRDQQAAPEAASPEKGDRNAEG
jgi:negative regulator of sigma E activity